MTERSITRIYVGRRWDNWVRDAFFGRSDPGSRYVEARIDATAAALVSALRGAAEQSDILVLSPDHCSARFPGLYLEKDRLGHPSLPMSTLDSLASQVDLRGKTVLLGGCCSEALAPAFLRMGAGRVYGTTEPDFDTDWWAIRRHMDAGDALPPSIAVHVASPR